MTTKGSFMSGFKPGVDRKGAQLFKPGVDRKGAQLGAVRDPQVHRGLSCVVAG